MLIINMRIMWATLIYIRNSMRMISCLCATFVLQVILMRWLEVLDTLFIPPWLENYVAYDD